MNEETKEYRTLEQWEEICESAINGNWSQAGQECVDYGFWADDMINMFEVAGELAYPNLEPTDLAILTEIAMKIRCKNGVEK